MDNNNITYIEYLYILTLFIELLKPNNNSYKYINYYTNYITNLDNCTEKHIVNIISFIKFEQCLNKVENDLEEQIINAAKHILTPNVIYKKYYYNDLLRDELNVNYRLTEHYGIKYRINFRPIFDIDERDIDLIVENLKIILELKSNLINENFENVVYLLNYFSFILFNLYNIYKCKRWFKSTAIITITC